MKTSRLLMAIMMILFLGVYGCGGGGDGQSSPPPPVDSGGGNGGGGGGGDVIPGDVIPFAPTGVNAVSGENGKVTLSWDSVEGATSYNVYISTATGVTKTNWEILNPASGSPAVITGLINETLYYFVITAVNSAGESTESAEVSATPTLRWTLSTGGASIVVVAPDKSVYVGGGATSGAISKFSAEGRLLWEYDTRDVSEDARYYLHGVAVRSNGEVYISRSIFYIPTFNQKEFVEKLDPATGAVLWSMEISPCGSSAVPGLAVNEYGIFAAGFECIAGLDFNGNILGYSYIPNLGGPSGDGGIESIVTDGANIYVAGNTGGDSFAPNAGGQDLFLAKYDQNGNLLWGKQWGGIDYELGPGICFDTTTDSVFVASGGWISSFKGDINLTFSHFDASGDLIMEKVFPDIKNGWGTALQCESGKMYVEHNFYNANGWKQSAIMNLDQDGTILWDRELPLGSYLPTANAIAVDSANERIFLGVGGKKLLIYSLAGEPLN